MRHEKYCHRIREKVGMHDEGFAKPVGCPPQDDLD